MKHIEIEFRPGKSGEEGVALLFALGFLSMMLVLGLGFVTTSLLSQKIAANNSTRAQARMLARSAASRAAMYIMLYNDQSIVNEITLNDYSNIGSYDKVAYNDNGTTATDALDDQLHKGTDANGAASKLNYKLVSQGDKSEDFLSDDQRIGAKWIYFYDSPHGTPGRKIIGRAAFQVLPGIKSLSLYRVTGGKNLENELGVKPFDFRWGRDVDELRLDGTQTLPEWSTQGLTSASMTPPYTYNGLYTAHSDFFPSGDLERPKTAKKKKWLEYWFAEGKSPITREVYPAQESAGAQIKYYHRFNIGDYYTDAAERANSGNDNWYDRFKTPRANGKTDSELATMKNYATALDELTSGGVEARDDDADDAQLDVFGLPFLRRIGDDSETHSFSSLELLRRQIAANFNDYCDADSIPTSDIPAADWSLTNAPQYTGNERTLYINEIALKLSDFKAEFSGATLNKPVSGTNHSKIEITSISPELLAELVNMYDKDDDQRDSTLLIPTKTPSPNYKLHTALKKLSFDIDIEATFKIEYRYASGTSTGLIREAEANVTYDHNATAKVDYSPSSPAAKVISGFDGLSKGYAVSAATLDAINSSFITQADESIFVNRIQSDVNSDLPPGAILEGYNSIKVTKIGCRIKTDNALIGFSNLLLENTSVGNVDYVRMEDAGNMTLSSDAAITLPETSDPGDSHTFADTLFIGGIEARDPRQNLNPNFGDPTKSDWNLHPSLLKNDLGEDTEKDCEMPSMRIWKDGTDVITLKAGLKNRYANPHAPSYVKTNGTSESCNTDLIDSEEATDPAWDDSHVSTAYIRNAPMVSPWEVGLIHRGREWQTLNIKSAGGFGSAEDIAFTDIKPEYNWTDSGTTYKNGDGAILDFVKMTPVCRTNGKIPLNQLRKDAIDSVTKKPEWNGIEESYNQDIIKMLFDGVRVGQTMKQFYDETKFGSPTQQGGTPISPDNNLLTDFVTEVSSISDLKLRSQFLNTKYGVDNGTFTFGLAQSGNDALQEELIGKTINLLAAEQNTPPNIFKVIVVAQTIKDIGGIGASVTISKLHKDVKTPLACQIGQFDFIGESDDWENNTYFDEITGEVKALVTIERVSADDDKNYGRMTISRIEYID